MVTAAARWLARAVGVSRRKSWGCGEMERSFEPKRIGEEGYDRLGPAFAVWAAENDPEVRFWFLGQVVARLGEGSRVLELGCGPGTAATELSVGRRYVGVDLSRGQLSMARRRVPHARFIHADLTTMAFRPSSFDGVVAFYVFNHLPRNDLGPTFERAYRWLAPRRMVDGHAARGRR